MKRRITFCVLIYMLAACTGNLTPDSTTVLPSVATQTPEMLDPSETTAPTLAVVPNPTSTIPPLDPNLSTDPEYQIKAELDYGWKVLTVQQQVVVPHPSTLPLNEIILVVQPNWYPGSFQLEMLSWQDGTPIITYTIENIQLTIPLSEPWEPGTSKTISIDYTLKLPPLEHGEEFGPNPFGYTLRQVNLTDWHPFVPPFVKGEWLVHNPWYYGEHLVYPTANYSVDFRLTNAPDNTVIAASALDQGTGNTHIYQIEQARNFALSVSPEYQVFREEIDGVTLLGYSFPYEQDIGRDAFEATVDAYKLYTQLFGPYQHESLTMVHADFLHGMEYDGLFFLSKAFFNTYDGTPASYLVAIAVHETAHQWWYGIVANDQAMEPWLDESLCTFAERLYYEERHPEALDWWLEYRVNYYEPQGWIDITIYESDSYRAYRDAVYLNGMNFLTELRSLVGADVFTDFLSSYLDRKSHEITTSDDFFSILATYSDVDWSQLKANYFQNP
jgi:hypothetical protein